MAYVGDTGKRTAPKRASRPARKSKPPIRNAPHPVQTPPGGDIASSGGDYGTHAAKRYSASHAFRKSVRETYAAQTPKRRQQVSSGARHQPGPAAAVIRHEHTSRAAANRRAAGTDTPSGNIPGFGQVQQQRRSEALVNQILQAHRRTPISSSGDTKSDLELTTAEAYKATPQFQKDFAAAAVSAGDNSPGRPGLGVAAIPPPTGAAKAIEDITGKGLHAVFPAAALAFKGATNISTLAGKYLGPNYKPGWQNLPANLFKQSLDMPGQVVPSVTKGIIEPAARGDVKTAASNAIGIPTYTAIAKHPVRELQEHPLSTGLAVAGPLKGASNILRAGAVRTGAIPPLRPPKVFPNTGLTSPPRPVARGIVGAVKQTIADRNVVAPKDVSFHGTGERPHTILKQGLKPGDGNEGAANYLGGPKSRHLAEVYMPDGGYLYGVNTRGLKVEGTTEQAVRGHIPKKHIFLQPITKASLFHSTKEEIAPFLETTEIGKALNKRFDSARSDFSLTKEEVEALLPALKRSNSRAAESLTRSLQTWLDDFNKYGKRQIQPPELMTNRDIRKAAAEAQHSSEQRRRTEREVTAMTARSAIGKKVTPAHILAAQNYIKTVGDVKEYVGQIRGHQEREQAAHNALAKSTPKKTRLEHRATLQARGKNIKALEDFLKSDEIKNLRNEAELPPKIQAEVEAYKAVAAPVQEKLGNLYGEQERVRMRGLLPYAQKRMGAKHVKTGHLDNETGRLIPKEEVNALKRDLTAEEFDKRIQPVSNVWKDSSGKIISSKDIEAHQRLEGPKVAPEVAAEGELSIRQRELAQAERDAATFRSGTIKKTWGVADDRELTNLRQQLEELHPADPRKLDVEGDLALSIVEKRDLARASGKDVSHGMTKKELTAVENLASVRQKVLETERKIGELRLREGTVEGAGPAGGLIRPRIKELEDQLVRLKNEQKGRVSDWINERTLDPTKGADATLPATLYRRVTGKRAEVDALKQRIETEKGNRPNTITPAAYISHAPNRKSIAAYFVSTNRAQKITPAGYTGKALDEGLLSLHKDVPIEDIVKSQGLVTAIEQYGRMVRDISVRKDAVPNDADGLVDDPAHPQVATFNTKQNAQRVANDWNVAHPKHTVAPFRISFTKGAQETILGDESDVMAGQRAENAMINAIRGEDTRDGGNWGLASDEFLDTSARYLKENKPISRMIGSQFRRTVLAFSIPWMVGNFGEATLRSAIERSGPRSYYTGKHVLSYLKKNDPEAYHYLTGIAAGGGHYGLRRSAGIYTGAEHLQNAGPVARRLGDAIMKLKTNPVTKHPAALVGGVWDAWTDLVFDRVNGPIESQFQTAMMGKAFRENLMPTKLVKLSKKAMHDAVDNKLDPRTMDMLGREVDRMYGKYSKFSPQLKRLVSHETPFIAWYLNAVNFIYKTMPRNHPLVTSVINNADTATREWRKEKGLGMFLDKHVPAFLQGSVPTKSGNLRVGRYTPFGLMGDPVGGAAGVFFPQAKTILLNLIGLDWKGDPIPGYEQNNIIGVTEAIKSISSQLVPGYTIGNKALNAKEDESLSHHVRRTLGDPFLKSVSPEQLKAAGGGGSSADKYSISKPSGGGGSSDDKYKIGGSAGRPKKSKDDKYKIK